MNCPECGKDGLKVTHSYRGGTSGVSQRRVCVFCDTVVTTSIVIVAVNPKRGEGASAVAAKMAKEKGPYDPS